MMTIKTFVICALFVAQSIQATSPDVLTKRDNAVDVDPYAAYYEQYSHPVETSDSNKINPLHTLTTLTTLHEKQGFAPAMEAMFGQDAGLVLGTIGAVIGTLAAVGVVLNNNNIHSLSKDQDSICTSVKGLGNLNIAAISSTNPTATEWNNMRTPINAIATPTC